MITLDVMHEFCYQYMEGVKLSKNNSHVLARCPLCGDSKKSLSKKRFNMDFNSGQPIYHCWNCTESGSFLTLYSNLKGLSISQSLKELNSYDPDYLIQKLSKKKEEKIIQEIEYEYHDYILKDCISATETVDGYMKAMYQKELKKFIRDRKLSIKVFVAYKGEYQRRFIIPIYNDGHIVYFQARAMIDEVLPKYMNPTLTKGNIIYNKDNFHKNKHIVICEGLIDAATIGKQGTACLGSEISKDFINEVTQLTNKGLIICLDNDKAGLKSVIKLIDSNNIPSNTKFFLFPYKYGKYSDINEFFVNENINNIYNFVKENSYSSTTTYTKLKMDKWRQKILNV
jgi:DNA primase